MAKPFLEFNCANESLVIRILGENTAEPTDFIFYSYSFFECGTNNVNIVILTV